MSALDAPIRVRIIGAGLTGTIDPRDEPTFDAMGDGPFYRVTTAAAVLAVHDDELEVLP